MTSEQRAGTAHRHHGPLSVGLTLLGEGRTRSDGTLRVVAPGQYHLAVANVGVLAGLATSTDWHERARQFAERGEVVHVTHDDRHVVSLGSVSAGSRERRRTGSARIRLGSWPGAAQAVAPVAVARAAVPT